MHLSWQVLQIRKWDAHVMGAVDVRAHVAPHAREPVKQHVRGPVMALANGAAKAHVRVPVVITLVKAMPIVKV